MSLDFSFRKCAKLADGTNAYDHPYSSEKWHPIASQLAQLTMVCGFREITAANCEKVFARISLYQQITGPSVRYGDGTKVYITLEDVKTLIGMTTNASTYTDAQWAKHIVEIASRYLVDKTYNDHDLTGYEAVKAQAERYAAELEQVRRAA
jgi:hypothetical protein